MKKSTFIKFSILVFSILMLNQCNSSDKEKTVEKSEETSTKIDSSKHISQGQEIALASQAILGKNLMQAIQENGTEYALSFCNEKALPLTDSSANNFGVIVQRISDKNRNPNNAAKQDEQKLIELFKKQLINDEDLSPQLNITDGKVTAYYPILTNTMCMQCHGKESTDIKATTLEKIHELYPNDKATNYAPGEIRGLWKITMNR